MIPFTLSAIAPFLNAERVGEDRTILDIVTDSRVPSLATSSFFIALKGDRFDGHHFAEQAVASGAAALLVNRWLPMKVPQLIVPDTVRALGQLGAWMRQQVSTRIVALTGSSGKTSVKEMTAAILRQCGHVLATAGNFNNHIGVPLTLLRLTPEHDFAVIELGANHLGEIAWMSDLVRPETALVNNLFAGHLAGLGSMSGVAQAKGEIFTGLPPNGRGILNADSHDWPHWKKVLGQKAVWRFAVDFNNNVDFFASDIISDQRCVCFILHSPQGECAVRLPLPGKHNVANALAASALALSVGARLPALAAGLAQCKSVPGRLFPIELDAGKLLLDDSYNANVGSMIAASQVLANMPGYRVMVVGDIAELGDVAVECHRQVGEAIALAGIDKVLSVGNLSHLIGETSSCGEHFQNKETLTSRLVQLFTDHPQISVLVKGSRSARMEQVVCTLREKEAC
ncbi:UDP-N-acetylmuramoyl-tripeptide--D-alanyl-D-alanine ligase [secondary endosymbiont of Ctenarytaina eucalypti]|uniref:UDP-N-acetylmuramoyl-tripeptide--D-alanyl-D-alanine ligase n=1 Tax=secondary endosymbiont of Ctenarytaina eucalypti TaxID=1199245 RepID=J3Z3E1_9ENTR|nr:UDP-N-acetylmuramoyl-tripeptide--D-alanyl-D-alanine ligase [secondary endosymbiont of Ctenarytaina eucalypti]AFP84754.1 UDP-N-acetylmuramoyl-tripeptide--D-alanyl-D-alanine ligase [secondary endosymbiont of Ctenarytaina eucalypti]